jgi:STAS-like domain of unknown function (DUF4325)
MAKDIYLPLPEYFNFLGKGKILDFDNSLSFFNWFNEPTDVTIQLESCHTANFATMSLLPLYAWYLMSKGSNVRFYSGQSPSGAVQAWRNLNGRSFRQILTDQNLNFNPSNRRPIFAIRNFDNLDLMARKLREFTSTYGSEYDKVMSYVISELIYNTLEHGANLFKTEQKTIRVPSILQYSWYSSSNRLEFIIADIGIGVKSHLERSFPAFKSHKEALEYAVLPGISGTMNQSDPYSGKNNAGMGLYFSTNIMRKLHADMYMVSGDGLLHVSPSDITAKTLNHSWPGTFIYVTINLGADSFKHEVIMSELREQARSQVQIREKKGQLEELYVGITNLFGKWAENKLQAVNYRDKQIMPALTDGKSVRFDFSGVESAPHSFLNALIATPVKNLGMQAYKLLRFTNVPSDIRDTIDYIMDENTGKDDE